MSGVLMLPETRLKVNACGHLTDISPEGSCSVATLLRELVGKLKVCNPASLQLADVTGAPIKTDDDLSSAAREGKTPLQAKLTVAALHEIEQKKKESRSKEHDMVGLQWQIIIEQVASFQQDLTAVAGKVQSVKDECLKIVRHVEDQEEVQRQQWLGMLRNETNDREVCQRDLIQKVDAISQLMQQERTAREVSDYQLQKQVEQCTAEINIERNGRSQTQAETARLVAAMRHDLDMDQQKNGDGWNKFLDSMKRLEVREKDHVNSEQAIMQRLTVMEGETEKIRSTLSSFDSNVCKQLSETHKRLDQHGKELEHAVHTRSLGSHHEIAKVAKDNETCVSVLDNQVQRMREEHIKMQQDLSERAKVLELRCGAHEKDLADHKDLMNNWEYTLLDRVHSTVTAVDSIHVDKQANDAVVRSTAQRAEDLSRRMQQAEANLNHRVTSDQWKAQMDNIIGVIQKLDTRVAQLDRDMHARLSMEASHREGLKNHLHGAIKVSLDKFSLKDGTEIDDQPHQVSSPEPHRSSAGSAAVSASGIVVQAVRTSPPPNGVLRPASSAHSSPVPIRSITAWPGSGQLTPAAQWAFNPGAPSPSGGSSRTVQAPTVMAPNVMQPGASIVPAPGSGMSSVQVPSS